MLCSIVPGVCVGGGCKGWRALRWLFVIDLIMENSPWHGSQRVQGLWHLHEKYSCCAGFCHKMPVDKAQPWQTAKREQEGHFKEGKRGMEGDLLWRGDRIMQHSCHVRFMVNIIDVSILVIITVRVCGMFLSRLWYFPLCISHWGSEPTKVANKGKISLNLAIYDSNNPKCIFQFSHQYSPLRLL